MQSLAVETHQHRIAINHQQFICHYVVGLKNNITTNQPWQLYGVASGGHTVWLGMTMASTNEGLATLIATHSQFINSNEIYMINRHPPPIVWLVFPDAIPLFMDCICHCNKRSNDSLH